ncbi:methyl-accepting chemotaxis protein [Candidatus Chlorohelix sp.]|uniref:methyl-accepting chemotaxis protein n=1 Tax=Candidatus Chlorohelix sp. TaxID=3139201 RepID=UPI003030ABCE
MQKLLRVQDWSIFYKLLAAFIIIALAALIPVSIINQQQARQGLLQEAQRNLANLSRNTTNAVSAYLLTREQDMAQIALNEALVNFMKTAQTDRSALGPNNRDQHDTLTLLKTRAPLMGQDTYLVLANPTGQIEITSEPEGGLRAGESNNLSDQTYFQDIIVKKKSSVITDPQLVRFNEKSGTVEAVIFFAAPVRDASSQIIGIAVARIPLNGIWQIVNADKEAAGEGSFAMLVDSSGVRIADSRSTDDVLGNSKYLFSVLYSIPASGAGSAQELLATNRFPKDFNFANKQDAIQGIFGRSQSQNFDTNNRFFEIKLNNADYQGAYGRTGSKQWSYYILVPNSTFAAAANNITNTSIILSIIAVVLLLIVAFVLANTLIQPIRRITRVLGRIGMGDFEVRVPVTNQDELGQLSITLNAMFDNTLTEIQNREEKEQLQSQITRLLEEISTVAEGDLTVQAEVTADMTGAIADSFNLMIEELRKTIINIQRANSQTNSYVNLMVDNAQMLDGVSDRQANRVMRVSGNVNEMNIAIQHVSASANDAAKVAQEALANARYGEEAVTRTISSMNRIRNNVQETAKKIKRLGESSQQIGEIVKLIDDIADQTNMLALNAAIQAATAGEQGKGFSMVTEEVRRLAQRSSNAVREIAHLVKSIQDDTASAVVAMEDGTSEVVEGSRIADEAGKALIVIEEVVGKLANLSFAISESSVQQAETSNDIARSMNEISSLTQEAVSLRRQSGEVVKMVEKTAQELRSSVAAFKVAEDTSTFNVGDFYEQKAQTQVEVSSPTFAPPLVIIAQTNGKPLETSNLDGFSHLNDNGDIDLSSLFTDESDFFDSIFDEVGTNKTPVEPPQALG